MLPTILQSGNFACIQDIQSKAQLTALLRDPQLKSSDHHISNNYTDNCTCQTVSETFEIESMLSQTDFVFTSCTLGNVAVYWLSNALR